ncbi:MAG TPA: AAA family ATPase [Longimicrobiales bacterium]|nr:AAA family ATPase [Longimicrobiales bacterium]
MITEDQSEVVAFLESPSTHGGAEVERVDTHSAVVFLAGSLAYKLKRAVRYDYLDFSTADRRREMCEAEVRLNRRTAPALYQGVVPVTRGAAGALALGGEGTPVDWLVVMNRFRQEALFDRLAAERRMELELMPPLAEAIAALHAEAEPRPESGGAPGMAWVIDGNEAGFAEFGAGVLDPAACRRVTERARAEVDAWRDVLEERRAAGYVRQCHGDLHLRNVVLLDGRPTLFDAVEFNDRIACIDVLYDLAFLLMDLWRRDLPRHANTVWNAYLRETDELRGIGLLPLFLSCRAAVRAKTSATAARLNDDAGRRAELEELARGYLVMAEELLEPPPPCLVAVGGFSGSGKSTLALGLAPSLGAVPGAVVARSDEIRKRLCGASPLERLGPEAYTAEVSERVYATIAERARAALRAGHAVVADAVFARPSEREAIERVAAAARVPFVGLWLEAPPETLVARVEARRDDASDADAAVVRMQLRRGAGALTWRRLDASTSSEALLEHARERVREEAPASLPLG